MTFRTRLAIPYNIYMQNPAEAIRQLLGQHITIEGFTHSDIVLPDDTVIVDVTYQAIPISLFQIYFVEMASLKPIMPDSDKYIAIINKCFVKITIPNTASFKKVVPIKIMSTLSNKATATSETQFAYFGTIVTQPLNTLCTPIRYINHSYEPFEVPPVKPIYPESYHVKIDVSEAELLQMCRNYKSALILHNILNPVVNVVSAKTYAECKPGTTGYVIPFEAIPINQDINGIILIQPKRIPNYVMFYPTSACTICIEELESIKRFLEQDLVNYTNFIYARDVLNA